VIPVLLVVVGLLAGAVIAIVAVGALLPVNHTETRTVTLRQSPDEVWKTVSDVDGYPSWRPGVRSIKRLDDGFWQEYDGRQLVTYEQVEATPPTRFVTRIADERLPYGGTWTVQVAPAADGGAAVTVTEDGEVYNPVFRFMSRFVFGHRATIDRYLAALAARI
jgi:hypothetical protein